MFEVVCDTQQTKKTVERTYLLQILLRVLRANFDHLAHCVHEVAKEDTTGHFKQRHQKAFKIVRRRDVSKSHTRQNSATPVPSQNILVQVAAVRKVGIAQPGSLIAIRTFDRGKPDEKDTDAMYENKQLEQQLEQRDNCLSQ